MARHGRRSRGHAGAHENEERWLLTYADMLTLMFALFMVLFSISSVNISKYETLQKSLKAAFSGSILSGGKAVMRQGSASTSAHTPAQAEVPSIVPLTPSIPTAGSQTQAKTNSQSGQTVDQRLNSAMVAVAAGDAEQESFRKLKQKMDAYARAHGFSKEVITQIEKSGLVIRVLTDKLLFDSGEATLKPAGAPLLDEIGQLLNVDRTHPITVAGHTDNQPIATAQFPSNWDLSAARATTVVRFLISLGVNQQRMAAAGYADLHPIASNATDSGRARNRRVEILLQRLNPSPSS